MKRKVAGLLSGLILGLLSVALPGLAQEIDEKAAVKKQAVQEFIGGQPLEDLDFNIAPVIVNGDIVFQVRGISSLPAKKRARRISRRIEKLASNPEFDLELLHYVDTGTVTEFYAGTDPTIVFVLLDEDAGLNRLAGPCSVKFSWSSLREKS